MKNSSSSPSLLPPSPKSLTQSQFAALVRCQPLAVAASNAFSAPPAPAGPGAAALTPAPTTAHRGLPPPPQISLPSPAPAAPSSPPTKTTFPTRAGPHPHSPTASILPPSSAVPPTPTPPAAAHLTLSILTARTRNSFSPSAVSASAQRFDGGYVHRGLLKAAAWILNREAETLRGALKQAGPECQLVFAGHSLGAGVAAMMAAVAVNCLDRFGGIGRDRVRCYAVAPARCMSIDLAVKYADVIHSVILQDDFLPRTPTPLEHIFGSIFCLPCLLFLVCMRDTFISEDKMLKDPKRLYAPGRMYHIVERKPCSCGRMPPVVKTAIPVEGRFEHIVLSCNAVYDHSLVWIEREAQKALDRMLESYDLMVPPTQPIIVREEQSLDREQRDALEKAAQLTKHHSFNSNKKPYDEIYLPLDYEQEEMSSMESKSDWEEMVEKLFDDDDDDDEGQEVKEKSSIRDFS